MKTNRPISSPKVFVKDDFVSLIVKAIIFTLLLCLGKLFPAFSQAVSPYSISPDWYFGQGSKLTFPSGDFPTSGAPTTGFTNRTYSSFIGPEASTSVCFRDRNVALYTNSVHVYNNSNQAGNWNIVPGLIRDLNNSGDNTCAGSAAGGSVAFPDPQGTDNAFYLILANDRTGGNCTLKGVNRYRFTGTGTTVAYNAGPTLMETNAFPDEAIAAGTDGAGGYWVVIHTDAIVNTFRVWHFTPTGITGPVDYTPAGAALTSGNNVGKYLKFSPCQDKLAYNSAGTVIIHNFNKTTGAVGAEIRRIAVSGPGVGLEFSPDGSKIYYTDGAFGSTGYGVRYTDIASGTSGIVATTGSWSLQLGLDGKIYTSPTSTNVGVISTPNTTPSYSTLAIPGGANVFRGISNMAWLSPQLPVVTATATATCNIYDFSFVFQNYFNSNIGINNASITWDWGDGSPNTTANATPQHTFPTTGGPYTVTLTFQDATCGQTWTDQEVVTITCPSPVELLNFQGKAVHDAALLTWQTALELNNDYFELQRSVDGITFQTIAKVKGVGNSKQLQSYQYTDFSVPASLVYYRLVQHDFDGKTSISNIVHVRFNNQLSKASVGPNPFNDSFTLTKAYAEEATISIFDILGRLLEQRVSNESEINVTLGESLANGAYIIQYTSKQDSYTFHVEKQ